MFQYQPYDNTQSIGQIIQLMMAGPQARARAAQQAGEARAHAMEVAGQNSAQLGQSLGNIAAGTANTVMQQYGPQAQALNEQRKAMTDERNYTIAQRQQATAEHQQLLQQRAAVDRVMKESLTTDPVTGIVSYDRPTLTKGMSALGLPPEDQKKYLDLVEASDNSIKTAKAAQNDAIKQIAGLVDATGNDPAVFENEVQRAIKNGMISQQVAAPFLDAARRDPSHIAKVTATILGKKPDLMTVNQGDSVVDKNNPTAGAVFTAAPKPEVKHFEQKPVLVNGKEAVVSYDPATGKSFDASGQDVSASVKPMPPAAARVEVNTGPKEGALDPEGLDYAATQYRLTGQMPALGMGKNADRGKIINAAAQQAKALGQSPAVAIQKQALRKADTASLTKMQTMKDGSEASESKALAQVDLIRDLSSKVSRTSWPIINKAIISGQKEITGDSNTTQLYNAILTFGQEYGKIIEGSTGSVSGSSEGARAAASRLISAAMSKGTLSDVLNLMTKEMGYTIQGYDATIDHITTRMGGQSQPSPTPTPTPVPAPAPTGTVKLQAPDGTVRDVPAAEADHYIKLGAKRIGR